jgi:hypothetical protein
MQAGPWANYSSFAAATVSDSASLNCRAIWVSCTVAGNIALSSGLSGAGVAFAVPVGITVIPVELNQGRLMATGTTATATYVLLQ